MYNPYSKNKHCIICKKLITNLAKRCNSCAQKERYKNPKNNANYIDGRTMKKYYCVDCRKLLSDYRHQRCSSCARKGEIAPNYIHGKGYEPYTSEFTPQLKDSIRKRDNYQCQGENCSMTQEEHFIIYGRDLEIHHMDYNRENCKDTNLITLCKQCNIRANYNREYWKEYFRYIMENKYVRTQ